MLKIATKEQYEDVLFSPNMSIVEKPSWRKGELTVKLISNGRTVAVKKTCRTGTIYKVETDA